MDKGRIETDKKLKTIEKRLKIMYSRAQKELEVKWNEYMDKANEKAAKLYSEIQDARTPGAKKLAEKKYRDYVTNMTLRDQHYKAMVEQYANDLLEVNKKAVAYVNDMMPEIYTINYNAVGNDIASKIKGYSFELVDEATIKNLATKEKTLLPYKVVNGKRDVRWNTSAVNNEILQGLLQGESIPHIADRLQNVTEMNMTSAIRNARTSTTSAENRGRMDSFKSAQEKGVVLHKVWMATEDGRTRDAHRLLDGQEQEIDEPFDSELGPIMYPGDPTADPSNVYNCRCTLTTKIIGFGKTEFEYPEEQEAEVQPYESKALEKVLSNDRYKEFTGLVNDAPTRDLYEEYMEKCHGIKELKTGGFYSPSLDKVNYSISKMEGQSDYSVLAHEIGHMFDYKIGKLKDLSFNEITAINDRCVIGSGITKLFKETASMSDGFLSALRKDMDALKAGLDDRSIVKEMLSTVAKRNGTAGVQDALDGFFKTQDNRLLPWGHGSKYYNRAYNQRVTGFGLDKELKAVLKELGFDASNQTKVKDICRQYEAASEAWANVASAVTCGGEELEAMQKYMPETVKEFERICEVLKP